VQRGEVGEGRRAEAGHEENMLCSPADPAPPGDFVDLEILALNFGYAIFGVVLMWLAYRVFDHLTPQVNFPEELKKGNVAVAIFVGSLFISIALVVGNALN
jgi:hypothetical protein